MGSDDSRKGGSWWVAIGIPLLFAALVLVALSAYRHRVHTTNVMLKDKPG